MNKKDYDEIANKIRNHATKEFLKLYQEEDIWNTPLGFLAEDLADYFEKENPKYSPHVSYFDKQQFLKNCEVK